MSNDNLEIPLHVLEDLETIRQTGKYNMIAGSEILVSEINNRPEMAKTLLWLVKEQGDYYVLDYVKYTKALEELGKLRGLADELTE